MTTVADVSRELGEYMLKGWVLTDRICTKCSKVPLMRSPPSATIEASFCVNCDSSPQPNSNTAASVATADSPSRSSSSHASRVSTPLTEVSDVPSSPLFAPLLDTDEILRRRQQSDTASAEIGKRMLRGWAMLADECPNPNCYGIPLVRAPKRGSQTDPHKECVICGTLYVDQADTLGRSRLVAVEPAIQGSDQIVARKGPTSTPPAHSILNKGKGREIPPMSYREQAGSAPGPVPLPTTETSTSSVLNAASRSLEQTLLALTGRLNTLSNASEAFDPCHIMHTAEAITKVSQALTSVKELHWSETRAQLG